MVQVHTSVLNKKNLHLPRFFFLFSTPFFFCKMEAGCLLLDIFITSDDLKSEFKFLD
jgi:hypothetical protein